MRIFKCSFAKFFRGSMSPNLPRRSCAFSTPTNAICDVTTFISAILSPLHRTLLEPPLFALTNSMQLNVVTARIVLMTNKGRKV